MFARVDRQAFGSFNAFGGGSPVLATTTSSRMLAQGYFSQLTLNSVAPGSHGTFVLDNGENGTLHIDGYYTVAAMSAALMPAKFGRR